MMPVLKTCSRVRFYVSGLGSENDVHSVNFDGQVAVEEGVSAETFLVLPSTMRTIDLIPRQEGDWSLHSNAVEHAVGGERAKITVVKGSDACKAPSNALGKKRTFFISVGF